LEVVKYRPGETFFLKMERETRLSEDLREGKIKTDPARKKITYFFGVPSDNLT
jgi:hypothetical protein